MDLATIGPILLTALGALGFIGQYLRGQARKDRIENRKLRAMALDIDEWTFKAQRVARQSGIRLPPLPKTWEAFHAGNEDPSDAAGRAAAPEADRGAGEEPRARHALRERG